MDFFKKEIENLKKNNLYREIKEISNINGKYIYINGKAYLDFASNNYLALRDDKRVKKAVIDGIMKYGAGSGASRLVNGTAEIYDIFEKRISEFKNKEAALIFNNGYVANLGVISSILDKKDIVFSDKLNHASIIDGAKLSGAKLIRYKHLDYDDLENKLIKYRDEYKKSIIITDTVFSMDGDKADLRRLVELKKKYSSLLMIDEAHGTGVLGKRGAGLAEEQGVLDKIDISMGTLGKAFGLEGAYICSSNEIRSYLVNKARSFIYSTMISPGIIAGALKSLEIIEKEGFRREKILNLSKKFKMALENKGYSCIGNETQILPLMLGENSRALDFSKRLMAEGIYAVAIRYPTVARKTARIRFSINYNIEEKDIDYILDKI